MKRLEKEYMEAEKKWYIERITKLLDETQDLITFDLVYKILIKCLEEEKKGMVSP